MGKFRWLHLSDLHRGAGSQEAVWPNVRELLHDDLYEHLDRHGPVDAVIVTGDLTNTGAPHEFAAFEQTACELDRFLTQRGRRPVWLTVPGNHDLARPEPRHPRVLVMERMWSERWLREEFWRDSSSEYRQLVEECFENYIAWRDGSKLTAPPISSRGLLPGDFSCTLDIGEQKVGFLGLNSAFLQLTPKDCEGALELSMEQAAAACLNDLPRWVNEHDACFLLTHHPPQWLGNEAREALFSELHLPNRFVAHLFGHMHAPHSQTTMTGGAGPIRHWQCPSTFGLKLTSAGVNRIHGYTVGELDFGASVDTFRLWPRIATKTLGGPLRFGPDGLFVLGGDGGTKPEPFERANARSATMFRAASLHNEPEAPGNSPPAIADAIANLLSRWSLVALGEVLPRSGDTRAPVTMPSIRESLLGDHETKKVADALLSSGHNDFLTECRRYEDLINDGDFDPHTEFPPSRRLVPSSSYPKLSVLHTYLDSPELKQNVAIVGPKGSGKTLHQNCWLHANNAILEDKLVFWIRCDGHRLFELWLSSGDFKNRRDKLISLEDYLALKLVYVLAKRGAEQTRPLLVEAVAALRTAGDFDEPVGRRSGATERRAIWDAFEAIRTKIERQESAMRRVKPRYRYLEDVVIAEAQQSEYSREFNRWLALATAIEGHLVGLGFRFLRILDGLDNVHATSSRAIGAYEKIISQAALFIGNGPGPARLNVAVLRERSYIDVKRAESFPCGRPEQLAINKIELAPTAPYPIQKGRFDLWRSASTNREGLITKILDSVCAVSVNEPADRYHFNHRAFLHNRLTLVRHVFYRLLQLGHRDPVPQDIINAQVQNLNDRNLLLNGRFFYDTTNDWHEMDQEIGECSFNLFHIGSESPEPTRRADDESLALLGCRVLQMIIGNRGVLEQHVLEYLAIMFGYPRQRVERAIILLRAFGMIDSILTADQQHIAFEASPAGERFLRRSFTHVDTLYYCALDTPVPESLVHEGFIYSHNNRTKGRSGYPFASMSTSLSFLAFVTLVGATESRRLARKVLELPPELKALHFDPTLPHEDRLGQELLRKAFRDAVATLSDVRDRNALSEFLAKLESLQRADEPMKGQSAFH